MVKGFRQKALRSVALLIGGHAILYPAFGILFFGRDRFLESFSLVAHNSTVLLSLAAAWGVYKERPWAIPAFYLYWAGASAECMVQGSRMGLLDTIPASFPWILAFTLSLILFGTSKMRRTRRFSIRLPVQLHRVDDDALIGEGETVNLSEGGCMVSLDPENGGGLSAGSVVRISLSLEPSRPTRIGGHVLSVDGRFCRMKFVKPTTDQRDSIREILKNGAVEG